jgi:hypothetical protein
MYAVVTDRSACLLAVWFPNRSQLAPAFTTRIRLELLPSKMAEVVTFPTFGSEGEFPQSLQVNAGQSTPFQSHLFFLIQ